MNARRTLLYILPALALLALVYGYSVIELVHLSVMRVGVGAEQSAYIGASNFSYFLHDPTFHASIRHNFTLFAALPVIVCLALLTAYGLNDRFVGWRLFRTISFLPYILSITVVGVIFSWFLSLDGPLNTVLRGVHLSALAQEWLGNQQLALWAILAIIVWKETGLGVLFFHAAMLDVPTEQVEAARIDGAGWWRRLQHIVVPHLRGRIELYCVLVAITLFSWVFGYVYVLTFGGPGTSTLLTELYIYLQTFRYGAIGVGAAVAVLLLGGTAALVIGLQLGRRVLRGRRP